MSAPLPRFSTASLCVALAFSVAFASVRAAVLMEALLKGLREDDLKQPSRDSVTVTRLWACVRPASLLPRVLSPAAEAPVFGASAEVPVFTCAPFLGPRIARGGDFVQ